MIQSSIPQIVRTTSEWESASGLSSGSSRTRFLLHAYPTEKVILLFHGFTAVPEQFVPIGEALFQAGYNVLIPLLPGHGLAGEWNQNNPPPLPEDISTYQNFAIEWLQHAQQFGQTVVVGGLSGGGTLAAWLALEFSDVIDRALLFSPYLSSPNCIVNWIVQTFNIYFKWQTEPGAVNWGYEGFRMPALRIFLNLGQTVLQKAKNVSASPLLLVTSECDRAVNRQDIRTLFHSALQFDPSCWYLCFDKKLNIQHNMMTKAEGNEHQDLVTAIAKVFIKADLP